MTRTRTRAVGFALVATLALLGACSDDDDPDAADDSTTTAAETTEPTTAAESTEGSASTEGEAADGATVAVAESDLGSILVDAEGVTLYVFASDTQGEASTCTEGCAAAWPALTGPVTAGDGVDEALLGTVDSGGVEQATYDGWPLYYYAQDSGPGETTGQGVGGVWWVIGPDGVPIEE